MIYDDKRNHDLTQPLPTADIHVGTVDAYRQLVTNLTNLGIEAVQHDESLQNKLTQYGNLLTDTLRWERRLAEAIELQEQLIPYLPDETAALRTVAATLKIEAGAELDGFRELHEIAEQDPDNVWGWITLGSSYLWTGQYETAEEYLLRVVKLEFAEALDRAVAFQYLFKLYGTQKRVDEALTAWEQATHLDSVLEATLPDLLRMLIYWYHYDTAERYLQRERDAVRQLFFQDLINIKRSRLAAPKSWEWVTKVDPKTLDDTQDEFAEACLRFVKPQLALNALEPLMDRGDFSRRRLALAGLAWAQQRMLDRSKWAFDLALRAGDLERPRGTRRSVGGRRVLDSETRILYGEIIVDPDIRKEIDHYFMPVVNSN